MTGLREDDDMFVVEGMDCFNCDSIALVRRSAMKVKK